MSPYQWKTIVIQSISKKRVKAPRILIGSYTVGPAHVNNTFTSACWCVGEKETGTAIGLYTDLRVAIQFAESLRREFGDIGSVAKRRLAKCSTDEDMIILSSLSKRRKHETFIDPDPEISTGKVKLRRFDPSILDRLYGGVK